jgi:valyl-tRNA synthetase
VLGHVLDQLLRLLHPVVPFVTDELWTALATAASGAAPVGTGNAGTRVAETVMTAPWPSANPALIDDAAENEVATVQRVVTEVRRFRSDQGLRPAQRVAARLDGLADAGIAAHEPLIRALVRLDEAGADFRASATLAVSEAVNVALDTRGSIDLAAERARLEKDRAAAEREADQARAKLANPAFVDKAPEPVVNKIKDRLAVAEADLARIAAALEALGL